MIRLSDVGNINTNVLLWKFQDPAMRTKFVEINKHLNMITEPFEKIYSSNVPIEAFKNKILYTANFKPVKTHYFTVINYPYFWMNQHYIIPTNVPTTDSKKYICLMNNDNYHRKIMYEHIKNDKDICYSCGWKNIKLPSENNTNVKAGDVLLYNYPIPVEYMNAKWDIVIETGDNEPHNMISEKTFRPLYVGKSFISFGFPGMYKCLENLGFKFDKKLTRFDKNREDRFDIFLDTLNNIKTKKVLQNYHYLSHNQKLAKHIRAKHNFKTDGSLLHKKLSYETFITKDMYQFLNDGNSNEIH
jgi:hypothetical protein